jgi:VTC domain-containing protein
MVPPSSLHQELRTRDVSLAIIRASSNMNLGSHGHGLDTRRAGAVVLPAASGDRELKYVLPVGRVGLARRMLAASCRADQEYPSAFVWTIYYDTPRLASLSEKINSDYLKLKIRLRWYSELDWSPRGGAFIEAKRRVGSRRDKVRFEVPHPAAELAQWSLEDKRLTMLPRLLGAHGITLHDIWHPVILIRYRRDRFVEPVSRARVNLDSEIAALALHSGLSSTFDPGPLALGVVEVKGWEEELPIALRNLLVLGARKQSFSKFHAVHRYVTRAIQ